MNPIASRIRKGRHEYQLPSGSWVSRQHIYQLRHREEGVCDLCTKPVAHDSLNLCPEHLEYRRKRTRNNYRIKAGIPLNAPIRKTKPRGHHARPTNHK